jgi:uncharacterized protein YecE (DUF72 family)
VKGTRSVVAVGTAGWSIPKQEAERFRSEGSHLERYAKRFNAVEINSSFYRPHRPSTYERWAASVPEGFRFAVKVPKSITHERRLKGSGDLLDRFLSEAQGLGSKLGPLLIQLPPSLTFQPEVGGTFLQEFRGRFAGLLVIEPRHASWFAPEVASLLVELKIGRVAADPEPVPGAGEPGGWNGLVYCRLHGSPRMYYSAYAMDQLDSLAQKLVGRANDGIPVWCIFDNTAAFAATGDALATIERTKLLARG